MISYMRGDLLDVKQGIIVHGVNCQGIMGAGIALAIRSKWPRVFDAYQFRCAEHRPAALLGTVQLVEINPELLVANAFTQLHLGRRAVSYDALAECFERLGEMAGSRNLALHFPLIGSGLGSGKWRIIERIIDESAVTPEKFLWVLP